MHRRQFIQFSSAASLLSLVSSPGQAAAAWKNFTLTMRLNLPDTQAPARVWLPLPNSVEPYQQALDTRWSGTAMKAEIFRDVVYGAPTLYAEWSNPGPRELVVTSQVKTLDRANLPISQANAGVPDNPPEVRQFLAPTKHIPLDGIVLKTATEATQGARSTVEKARAIYDWVVDNSFRDPKVQGCGRGDIKGMLETGNLGGKCADINSLFVGLCRAVGIPARENFGIRVGPSKNFKSLGKVGNVTGAQHCRAEFYLRGAGWVPVDPADVRKVVLEEKLELQNPAVQKIREQLFGSWEMNWVEFNNARDFILNPVSAISPVNFLMYPRAEVDGVPRDELDAKAFVYEIEAKEITA
jgi:transglutaminase-like putative cysteine protease